MISYTHCGDIGDLALSLATIKHRGEVAHCYLFDNGQTKGIIHRMHIVKPLLEAQEYISGVSAWKNEPVDWRSERFREYGMVNNGNSLAYNHAEAAIRDGFISSMPDFSIKWLNVEPSAKTNGRVVVNATSRYRNPMFPWRKVVSHYGERILFVGMPDEHKSFCESFGQVEYKPTKDMLEVASLIAGSFVYIGNQSSAMCIAEGLKHPRILEGCLWVADCVYPGATNAQYVFDGSVILPDIGGSGILKCESQSFRWQDFDLNMVPQVGPNAWGWFYKYGDEMLNSSVVNAVVRRLKKLSGWDEDKCREEIVKFTVNLNPKAFAGRVNRSQFDAAKLAVEAAGIKDHPLFQMNTSGKFIP